MVRFDGVGAGLWVLMAGACADRTLGGETGGSSEAGTTTTGDTPTSTDPSSPGTTVPGTTVPGTTATTEPGTTATTVPGTTATTEPGTTVTSEPGTTTVDPSGPDTATEGPVKFDLPPPLPPAVPAGIMSGCTKEPPGLSAVKGNSLLGPVVSRRAYFGYVMFNGVLENLRLLFLDDAADVEVAMFELQNSFGEVSTGPALQVSPSQVFTNSNPFWLGVDEMAVLSVRVSGDATEVLATVEINGQAGDWVQVVPDDPARLLGTIAPGGGQFQFAGEFDAVYCHLLTQEIFAE